MNMARRNLDRVLKFLTIESPAPVQRAGRTYRLNPVRWQMPVERLERVSEQRRHEQERIRAYMASRSCLMQFLAAELNDVEAAPCGRCANCAGSSLPPGYDLQLAAEALTYLGRVDQPIDPRRKWPPGLADASMRGNISQALRASEGRSLCRWGDEGLGRLVRMGKQRDGRFDERLAEASRQLIQERWLPNPMPQWIVCVPSLRQPELVRDFGAHLAARLGIESVECLRKVRETDPQKTRQNSFQQASNLLGAFDVDPTRVRAEPVLLVDDVVDSRWTFTLLAAMLRRHGSGEVYPFALADSSAEDGD